MQQRVDQIFSSLHKERTTFDKHLVELKGALTKQKETVKEQQKLSTVLQEIQGSYSMLQDKQQALDESTKALHHLKKEYTDMGRRHSVINSDCGELLKSHTARQIRETQPRTRKPSIRVQSTSLHNN